MKIEFYSVLLGHDGIDPEKGRLLMETYTDESKSDAEERLKKISQRYGGAKLVKVTLEEV